MACGRNHAVLFPYVGHKNSFLRIRAGMDLSSRSHQLYKPMEFREVRVSEQSRLVAFARDNGIIYAQLKDF